MQDRIERVLDKLQKNNMDACFVATKAEVVPLLEDLLKPEDVVAVGGSVTLDETGVLDLLRGGKYNFIDRYAPGITAEKTDDIFHQSLLSDVYITSTNAVTENGELYNVDGRANRVSALAYGPKTVIVVVGVNKIVPDLPAAIKRVKTIAAPLNVKRLKRNTYCSRFGHCVKVDGGMTEGCDSAERICCSYLITGKQLIKDRIKVILVGEDCGY